VSRESGTDKKKRSWVAYVRHGVIVLLLSGVVVDAPVREEVF